MPSPQTLFLKIQIFEAAPVTILFLFLLIANFVYFWHHYMIHDLQRRPWYGDGGVKEMVSSVEQLRGDYEKVVISGDPYIFFLFYNKVKPKYFIENSTILHEKLGIWERVESFDNIIFKMPMDCPKIGKKGVLYVCKGGEVPLNSIIQDVIRFKDGIPAFILLEFVPYSERVNTELPEKLQWMVETDLSYPEALLSEESERYW